MATASDEGERTCPLCTEEMDLTDQQLKPCKCGYEICVWCWHHIMDMAEKDDTEGRCPACRTPYDKEKIVGMAANCERMVAEINSERRLKLQKAKSKTSEGRKHLSSVRVIQRNLVYIIGLPANLADEAILERKEYFGQYGKVLKVSITWPASGSQQSNTNTCSVYITYTKEEEAVRCIQSVHGFVLEGRSLRACFGTTKYCHTWLRNMPCNNPDCLYLHDMGSPEDSFTKDEIISAYTRVQQISGVANNSQRRSGNMLPPPADEFCNNSNPASGKLVIKSTSNNPSNQVMASPNCSSSGRSSVLPAAASWGLRVSSSSRPPAASMACLQGPANQKTDTLNGSFDLPLKTACAAVTSDLRGNAKKIPTTKESDPMHLNDRSGLEAAKYIGSQTTAHAAAKVFLDSDYATMANQLSTSSEDKDRGITKPPNFTCTEDLDRQQSCGSGCSEVAHGCVVDDETILTISSRLSAIDVDNQLAIEHPDIIKHLNLISDNFSTRLDGNPVGVQQHYLEYGNDTIEPLTSPLFRKAVMVSEGSCLSGELPNWSSELRTRVLSAAGREMDDTQMPDDDQRLKLSEAATYPSYLAYSCNPLKAPHLSTGYHSQDTGNTGILANADPRAVDKGIDTLLSVGGSVLSNRYDKNKFSSYELGYCVDRSDDISNVDSVQCLERYSGDASEIDRNASIDLGESTIISNILSWDLDAGDDSLTSPRSLAKLLGETDKQNSSLKLSSPWRLQNSSQSRFSFARQEDFVANRATQLEHSFSNNSGDAQKNYINLQDSIENSNTSRDKFRNGFTVNSLEVSESLTNGLVPPNKVAVSRPQISAPPGFSVPSRSPPPGFTSQERVERAFVPACSGNQLLESLLLRKQYQAPSTGNNGGSFADVELIDPAILAVGKGTLPLATSNSGIDLPSTFSAQLNVSEHDSRLPLMMQQSFSTHPNFRFSDHMPDQFSPLNDSYTSSRFVEQTHGKAHMSLPQSRNSRISNNQWDGWNEVQTGNDLVLSEIVRNERLGLTKYFPGHEELKFHMSSSGNLYNRAFGM